MTSKQQQQQQQAQQQPQATNSINKMKGPVEQPPRPNPCTYWVTEHLLAGQHPTDFRGPGPTRAKLRSYLIEAGVTVFIDLTAEWQKPAYDRLIKEIAQERGDSDAAAAIEYRRLPVPDFGIPSPQLMTQILNTIDDAVRRNNKVYVHCAGGIGRTGTTVGCYLVRHGNTGVEALQELNRLFRSSDLHQKANNGLLFHQHCSDLGSSNSDMESYQSPETTEQKNFVLNWEEQAR